MLVIPLSTVDTLATLVYPTVDSGITITLLITTLPKCQCAAE